MPLYLIERNFAEQLNLNSDIAKAVTNVNSEVGINWLFSFLSADKKKHIASTKPLIPMRSGRRHRSSTFRRTS